MATQQVKIIPGMNDFPNQLAVPGAGSVEGELSNSFGIWYDPDKNAIIVGDGSSKLSEITPIGPQYWKVIS